MNCTQVRNKYTLTSDFFSQYEMHKNNAKCSEHMNISYHIISCTHALMHSCTHALMHSYTHALIHSRTHTLMHSYTHALIHSCTHTLMHSYTHDSCTHTLMHSCTHALMHSCTHKLTHSSLTHSCTYTRGVEVKSIAASAEEEAVTVKHARSWLWLENTVATLRTCCTCRAASSCSFRARPWR